MNWVENFVEILGMFGITGFVVLAIIGSFYIIKEFFPIVEIVLGHLLGFIGWASKWIRRTSISSEIEGSINQAIFNMNSEFEHSLFPTCEVKWVTANNKETVVEFGKAIVRVSFSQNSDMNTFAAAHAYAQAAVLSKTRPFLSKTTAKAIDLVLIKLMIIAARRSALTVFNIRFKEQDKIIKDTFFKLEYVHSKGLFSRILLPELHYFGELLGEKSPSEEFEHQADSFIEWLNNLTTREHEEKSILTFERSHLKIGVILVGKEETLKEKGIEPYLKWAGFYASKEFHLVYLLSRGKMRGRVVKDISKILTDTGAFESLTRKPDYVAKDSFGEDITITCIALRPNITRLLQVAWEKLSECYNSSQIVPVIINEVHGDGLILDAYGLRVPIHSSKLSSLTIPEISNFFRPGMELAVKVESINPVKNEVMLTNVNTDTDPKRIIDSNLSLDLPIEAIVQRIKMHDGQEMGVELYLRNIKADGFIPRSRATYSRFVSLTDRFKPQSIVQVKLLEYKFQFGNYVCTLSNLKDPWETITKYEEGNNVNVIVREVAERYLNVELEEGLEGRIHADEISWASDEDNLKKIREYTPGTNCQAQITKVDYIRKTILLSIKKCFACPAVKCLDENRDKVIEAIVNKIFPNGAHLSLTGVQFSGFVPISEITWLYCDDIKKYLAEDDWIKVIIMRYNEHFNNLICSIKRIEPNDSNEFLVTAKNGDIVLGNVREYVLDRYRVAIDFSSGKKAQAYIHRNELSNFLLNESTYSKLLDVNKIYPFLLKYFDERAGIIELSRKRFFDLKISGLEYGKRYLGKLIRTKSGMFNIYSDEIEAVLIDEAKVYVSEYENIEIVLARIDKQTKRLEATLA